MEWHYSFVADIFRWRGVIRAGGKRGEGISDSEDKPLKRES